MRAIMTARAFTSAGRFSPLGPVGIILFLTRLITSVLQVLSKAVAIKPNARFRIMPGQLVLYRQVIRMPAGARKLQRVPNTSLASLLFSQWSLSRLMLPAKHNTGHGARATGVKPDQISN
jgi:hypothetical protein